MSMKLNSEQADLMEKTLERFSDKGLGVVNMGPDHGYFCLVSMADGFRVPPACHQGQWRG